MKKLICLLLLLPSLIFAQLSPLEPTSEQLVARLAFYEKPKLEPTIEQQIYRYSAAEHVNGDLMLAIATCESRLRQVPSDKRNANGTYDWGITQINDVNIPLAESMGLDVKKNVTDNLKFAAYLLKTSGISNWSASMKCISKYGSFDG